MTYDFIIVGGGPGGYTAALRAAALDKKVALVEKSHLGGVCLNWGCIPTKSLLRSSKLYEQIKNAGQFGISCQELRIDLAQVVGRKNKVVEQLRQGLGRLMDQRKIEVIEGRARLEAPGRVLVDTPQGERSLEGRFVILAPGSDVAPLPGLECDGQRVLDIKAALDLSELPRRLLVVGAGVVGCEMAQFFGGLGCQVSMVDILEAPLGGALDADLAKLVVRQFKKRKVKLFLGTTISSLQKEPAQLKAVLASGQEIECDVVLVAVGMKPNTSGLGLEEAGVELDQRGYVKVNRHGQSSQPTVYGVGDATGLMPLAHFASHMGQVAVRHALGDQAAVVEELAVPKVVFMEPELAWVGLDQDAAQERYGEVKTGQFMIRGLGRATAEAKLDGLVKLVARAEDEVLVGAHIMGPQASGLVAEATLAVARGLTLGELAETIHAHPTYEEALPEAADAALGRPLH